MADPDDPTPAIELIWDEKKLIQRILLLFDTNSDHAMESVLMTHPETVMPFCVRNYFIEDENGKVVHQKKDNYQTRNEIVFEQPLQTKRLKIVLQHPSADVPAALFAVRCYGE